jgi:hypothetical protein
MDQKLPIAIFLGVLKNIFEEIGYDHSDAH